MNFDKNPVKVISMESVKEDARVLEYTLMIVQNFFLIYLALY